MVRLTTDQLLVDDRIFVHVPREGYVGVGTVTSENTPVSEFEAEAPDGSKNLLDVVDVPEESLGVMESAGFDHPVRLVQHSNESLSVVGREISRVHVFVSPQPSEDTFSARNGSNGVCWTPAPRPSGGSFRKTRAT